MVATGRLHHRANLDLVELASARTDRDELRERVLGIEEVKRKFEEHYDLLTGETASAEEHVASLDGSVEHLGKRVETLVGRKDCWKSR